MTTWSLNTLTSDLKVKDFRLASGLHVIYSHLGVQGVYVVFFLFFLIFTEILLEF